MIDFALPVQLDDTELAVQEAARRFAGEVLRPVGAALDKLPAGEMIQEQSPLFDVHRQYRDLGFAGMRLAGDLTPAQKARLVCLIGYELGRGDVGLALSLGAANFPAMVAANSGRRELMEQFTSDQIGCWGITEPDHGSDELDVRAVASQTGQNRGRANCIARPDGNSIVINGQKSSWVSNGTIAETAALFCAYDDGSDEAAHGVFLVDLKEKGRQPGQANRQARPARPEPGGNIFRRGAHSGGQYGRAAGTLRELCQYHPGAGQFLHGYHFLGSGAGGVR
ncbi:MAG: acyl-CoA dehydrogenase family protein [Alphaproteobacteria bacterium]|nr:acyl-CoA dehydrogenase family protein [Alphaproteobacteria bacterium]